MKRHIRIPEPLNRGEFLFIAMMDGVNEAAIPRRLCVEVVAEAAVDKRFNHVGEGDKNLEVKIPEQ